jgi:hypothetical protein
MNTLPHDSSRYALYPNGLVWDTPTTARMTITGRDVTATHITAMFATLSGDGVRGMATDRVVYQCGAWHGALLTFFGRHGREYSATHWQGRHIVTMQNVTAQQVATFLNGQFDGQPVDFFPHPDALIWRNGG